MTQEAVVTGIIDRSKAEVCVTRLTACGGSCSGCETCMLSSEVKVIAVNSIGAVPGQRVVIESNSGSIFKALALVYIMPVIFFLAGYVVASFLGLSERFCIAASFLALVFSAAVLVLIYRTKKHREEFSYTIIRFSEGL